MATAMNDKSNSLTQKVSSLASGIKQFLDIDFQIIKTSHSEHIGEALFLIGFFAFTFGTWYTYTAYQSFFGLRYSRFKTIMYATAIVCCIGKCLLQRYRVKDVGLIFLLMSLIFISSRLSGSRVLFWIFLFIISARGMSLIPVSFVLLCAILLVAVFAFSGFATGTITDYILNTVGGRGIRHSLGLTHPNTLAMFFFVLYFASMTLKRWKVRAVDICICFIFMCFEYFITGSRTVTFCFVAVLIASVYIFISPHLPQHFKKIVSLVCSRGTLALSVISIAISIAALFLYDPKQAYWRSLNRLASQRLELMHGYYSDYGLTVLGRTYNNANTFTFSVRGDPITFVVDNLFARMILLYGVLLGIIVIVGLLICQVKLLNGPQSIYYGFSLFIVIGLVEKFGQQLDIDYFLLAIGTIIYSTDLSRLVSTNSMLDNFTVYRMAAGLPPKKSGKHADQHPQSEELDPLSTRAYKERQPYHAHG